MDIIMQFCLRKHVCVGLFLLGYPVCALAQDTWIQTEGPFGGPVNNIIFMDNENIFIGTPNNGIYRSKDGGLTWNTKNNGLTGQYILALASGNDETLFAAVRESGLFRSTDNGELWQKLQNAPSNNFGMGLFFDSRGYLYAGLIFDSIYRSTDNGDTWSDIAGGLYRGGISDINKFLEKNDGEIFGFGANGLARTSDNGDTWKVLVRDTLIHSLAAHPNGYLFATAKPSGISPAFIMQSKDNGSTWQRMNLEAEKAVFVNIASDSNASIYTANNLGDLYKSEDLGVNWEKILPANFVKGITSIKIPAGKDIFLTTPNGLFLSGNGGEGFSEVEIGQKGTSIFSIFYVDSIRLWTTTSNGVHFSNDRGKTWQKTISGLTDLEVTAITLNKIDELYATTRSSGVFRFNRSDSVWENIGLNSEWCTDVDFDSSNTIYVSTSKGGFYKSSDMNTWIKLEYSLVDGNDFIRDIEITPANTIYLATSYKIYRSNDQGENWVEIRDGLPNVGIIHSLHSIANGKVLIAVYNKILRLSEDNDKIETISELPDVIDVLSIFSNAFSNYFVATRHKGAFFSMNSGKAWQPITIGAENPEISIVAAEPSGYIYLGTFGSSIYRNENIALPPKVTLNMPENKQLHVPVTTALSWNPTIETIAYTVQFSNDSSFSTVIFDSLVFSGVTLAPGPLENNETYFWHVRANNMIGYGSFSETWQFKTIVALPEKPFLYPVEPDTTDETIEYTFRWSDSGDDEVYEFQVSADSNFAEFIINETEISDTLFVADSLKQGPELFWRVKAKNIAGESDWSETGKFQTIITGVRGEDSFLPENYILLQNYPNPFNPETTIEFGIPESSFTELLIVNATGKKVATLLSKRMPAGWHKVIWNPRKISSGVYFVILKSDELRISKKMILLQ
jgi:photosystem II stability/assembly factor-like uncharacterized protein